MNGFFQGRLINRKVGFLDTIEKNNLQTGIKSKKKKKKKRQKVIFFQLFKRNGKHLDIRLSLEEAFSFPITTVPLSIATSDGKLR